MPNFLNLNYKFLNSKIEKFCYFDKTFSFHFIKKISPLHLYFMLQKKKIIPDIIQEFEFRNQKHAKNVYSSHCMHKLHLYCNCIMYF